MSWIGRIATNVLRNVFAEKPPNLVIEVRSDDYSKRHIHARADGIVLYDPLKDEAQFEIVLLRTCTESLNTAYSLYRSVDLEDIQTKFTIFKDTVPPIIQICKEMCTVSNIQKLCDLVLLHPSWTLAHIAAYFGLHDAFNHAAVNSHLNSSDAENGISPLQVAIQTNNLKTVQLLIASQSSLEHLDFDRNTVYHYAATSNKNIILALGERLPKCLNYRNKDGHTPMHVACLNDKPECVKALLLMGADVNIPATGEASSPGYVGDFLHSQPRGLAAEDMKFGGTPLHWACSREVINALIEKNCDINAVNFDNRTALHVMVMKKKLDCVVSLLSHMALVNVIDKEGNTPLHVAVTTGVQPIVQILLCFGADMNIKNFKEETPVHVAATSNNQHKILFTLYAVGAKRCTKDMQNCSIGCKWNENFIGVAPPEVESADPRTTLDEMLHTASMEIMASLKQKKVKGGRLLCLDGGGIRGLVLVQMLMELETLLNRPLIHCFDWISGTSTGGILALGLATGRSLKECQALYFRIKDEAFVGIRPYSSEILEKILKDCLGAEILMSEIEKPKLIITGVLADRKPVELHMFRNYESPSSMLNVPSSTKLKPTLPPHEQMVWEVARATGAAPTYFRAFGRFLDGGLIANNPTLDAMTEINEYNIALRAIGRHDKATPISLVVSVGTGLIPLKRLTDIDFFRPESLWDTARLAMGISALGTLLVDQATASDGRVVDRARNWCSMIGVPYYRLSPQLSSEVAMDENDDKILAEMIWSVKAFAYSNRHQLKEIVTLLAEDT